MTENLSTPPDRVVPSREPLPFLARYGRFLLVGLTGVVVNLVVFAGVLDLVAPAPGGSLTANLFHTVSLTSVRSREDLLASAIAFVVATFWNFEWNNAWTFRSRVGHLHSVNLRLGLYYGVSLGSLAVNELVLFGTLSFLFPLYGQGLGIVLGSVVGFLGNQRFTFAERQIGIEDRDARR